MSAAVDKKYDKIVARTFMKENKVPLNRYTDIKTRSIIDLPKPKDGEDSDDTSSSSNSSLVLHQKHFMKKMSGIILSKKFRKYHPWTRCGVKNTYEKSEEYKNIVGRLKFGN